MRFKNEEDKHNCFLRLFTAHEAAIHRYVRSLVYKREDALDVMQKAAIVLWKKFGQLKKEDEFKKASKEVKSNQWDNAIDIWKNLVNLNDKKIASKASYNMALAAEIKGSLDVAIDWAKKAKALGDKKANSYISILNKRKQDQVKLNKQLNN